MEPQSNANAKKESTMKGILVGGGVGLLLAILTYFIGAQVGRTEAREQVRAANAQVEAAQTEAARDEGIIGLLRARGHLTDAAISLERRNYGVANESLRRAAQMLQQTDAAAAGVDAAQIDEAGREVTAVDLTVRADVGEQRARIFQIADQIGQMIPAPPAAPEPAADATDAPPAP